MFDDFLNESAGAFDEAKNFFVHNKNRFNLTDDSIDFVLSVMATAVPKLQYVGIDAEGDVLYSDKDRINEIGFNIQYDQIFISYSIDRRGSRGCLQCNKRDNPLEMGKRLAEVLEIPESHKNMPKEVEKILSTSFMLDISNKSYTIGAYTLYEPFMRKHGETPSLSNNIWMTVLTKNNKIIDMTAHGAGMFSTRTDYNGTSIPNLKTWLDETGFKHL
jgi:hypothetical protein